MSELTKGPAAETVDVTPPAASAQPQRVSSTPDLGLRRDRPYPRWYLNSLQKEGGASAEAAPEAAETVRQGSAAALNLLSAATPEFGFALPKASYYPPNLTNSAAVHHPADTAAAELEPEAAKVQPVRRHLIASIVWEACLGVDEVEGPYPQWQMFNPVRWIIDRSPTLVFRASATADFLIRIRCRCELHGQTAGISVNDTAIMTVDFPQTADFEDVEFPVHLLEGVNRIQLTFSTMSQEASGNRGELVLLLENVEAVLPS